MAAALRPRGHNKCAALWAAAAAAGTAAAEAARMMSRRSRGRNSTHDVLNYSNPGKESWSGHGAFRGARRRRRGLRLRRPLTRRGAAYKYWRTLGRRKMDRCGNLRALWGGLIDVLVQCTSKEGHTSNTRATSSRRARGWRGCCGGGGPLRTGGAASPRPPRFPLPVTRYSPSPGRPLAGC